ncbi:4-(cytidine 5'-diphospho)-2-C-methyl-D-erythritol kinase [Haloimpatiens massiliensis]|uniref:4-(cytidine 5'-diphospho)-2-C-methyl-D-erythritol kinase n=1 Tax=Haloimpatiens massiliensis TaxID=1658110 RepID=UPI000C85E956|nr:4-(cytidine 5'-diphospho)-2-C-methyl-D-erythritol kinase [Haloimpatiens massiliensis]
MLMKAYAKINISLDVVGKRADGYHLLKMIMQNIDLYDIIRVEKRNEGISIGCDKTYVPLDERNIAYKAARLFLDTYNIDGGVEICIKKNIPVSAGLAGGSTDAAAVLKCMRNIYEVDVSDKELMNLGVKIGADVPYCILGGTALCEGIGELITPLKPFKNKILVLVKPNFGVSTKEVYKSLNIEKIYKHPETENLIKYMEREDLISLNRNMKNILENVTIKNNPTIKKIKMRMMNLNALGSLMSGSGPSVFGFFDDMLTAQRCYEELKKDYSEVFITRTI